MKNIYITSGIVTAAVLVQEDKAYLAYTVKSSFKFSGTGEPVDANTGHLSYELLQIRKEAKNYCDKNNLTLVD